MLMLKILVMGKVIYGCLLGDVVDSLIVEDKNQFLISIGVVCQLNFCF